MLDATRPAPHAKASHDMEDQVSTLTQFAATRSGRAVAGFSFLLFLVVACASGRAVSEAPAPTGGPVATDAPAHDSAVSATMLRVLAETADEFRTGSSVYLVAAFRFPHKVLGGFATRATADSIRAAAGAGYGVFGPYLTSEDPGVEGAPTVISVRVELETAEGREVINVNPDTVDALFFSQSAYDKFVTPYYSRVYGAAFALELLEVSRKKRPKGHCLSRLCLVYDPGNEEYQDPFEAATPR